MSSVVKRTWRDAFSGPCSEGAIRDYYQPNDAFRISRYEYAAGVTFDGAMHSARCIVLAGSCQFTYDSSSVILDAGEFADLISGKYTMDVIGPDPVVYVLVWTLPSADEG